MASKGRPKRWRSREKALRSHARRRARERYGFELGPTLEARIVKAIQNGAREVERQSHRVSVHDVDLGDDGIVRVVYDRTRQQLITLLPKPGERSGGSQ